MKDLKRILTNIAAIMTLIGLSMGAVAGAMASYSVVVPIWMLVTAASLVGVAVVFTQWASGRNADLSKKSQEQLRQQALAKDGNA